MKKIQKNSFFENRPIPENLIKRPLIFIGGIIIMLLLSFSLIFEIFTFSARMIFAVPGFMGLWFTYKLIQKFVQEKKEYDSKIHY